MTGGTGILPQINSPSAEIDKLRATIAAQAKEIEALRALVDHQGGFTEQMYGIEYEEWTAEDKRLSAAAGRLPNGEWKP